MMIPTRISAAILSLGIFAGMPLANAGSNFVVDVGFHLGGDQLAEVFTTTGRETVDAGGLISLGIGIAFDLAPNLESRITFGIKENKENAVLDYYGLVPAKAGDVTFIRYPVDVLFLLRTGGWKIGGGITYHLNPVFTIDTKTNHAQAEFDDALGFVVELDREVDIDRKNGQDYLGFRLTFIEYDSVPSATVRRTSVNGNSFGIVMGSRF